MSNASIGDRVRDLRKKAKLTQEELARQIGVVNMTISRIERGTQKPDDTTIDALVARFKVTEAWIRYGIEETRVTYDRDEDVDRAAETAGLDADQRHRLYDACRSIGPMSPGELLQTAERIARNAKTDGFKHAKAVDRAQAEPSRAAEIDAKGYKRVKR
jgi:transcriptional regulator with XRE-family HTH domain